MYYSNLLVTRAQVGGVTPAPLQSEDAPRLLLQRLALLPQHERVISGGEEALGRLGERGEASRLMALLPVLMRSTGITGKPLGSWLHGDVLPIEVDLDKRFRFHSVFACPVTRELATKSNAPKMLPCGHVFSNDSIAGLARPAHRSNCPFCPSHQTTHQVRPVYF